MVDWFKGRGLVFWLGVLLLVVSVVFAFIDLLADWPTVWGHSLFTEVVAGLALLGVTVFSIETVVRRREDNARDAELDARWQGLGGVGFRSIGTALGDVVDGMAWLLTGAHPLERPPDLRPEHSERLVEMLERCGQPPVQTNDTGDFTCETFEARLDSMLPLQDWCRFAHDSLDLLKWRFRDRIGSWASPMLELNELASILARTTVADERVGALQGGLRPLAGWAGDATLEGTKRLWFDALAEAMSLREDLQRAALADGRRDLEETEEALKAWDKFRNWMHSRDKPTADRRAKATLENEAHWQSRARDAVRLPLARTDALLAYWAAVEDREKLRPLRRRLTAKPEFPSSTH